jgi:uncharacterized protein (TIGR00730 family)
VSVRIAVYCGSNPGADPRFAAAARQIGAAMVRTGADLVYGGGKAGLMGIVADTVLEGGGTVVGVMPTHLVRREIAHSGLTELHETTTMHERKQRMIDESQAFIALPGGVGTLEELAEVLSWARIGLHSKPVGVLNTAGYYNGLLQFFDTMVTQGFLRPQERELVLSDDQPAGLIDRVSRIVLQNQG